MLAIIDDLVDRIGKMRMELLIIFEIESGQD